MREVHVAKGDPDAAPVKPAASPSLGLAANPRFAASKYCHHRPHYRTEDILLRRHGVRIPRHTLCHSDKVVAWLTDVLEHLPAMTNQDNLSVLLPSIWQPPRRSGKPARPETANFVESLHTCVCYLCSGCQHRSTPIR